MSAALYTCRISHVRARPTRRAFRYPSYLWLVDLDNLPRVPVALRPVAGFRARDHLGDPGAPIRVNVDRYLARHGIDLTGGRVLMLAHARVLGHVFNPLTVFWCHAADGTLAAVMAEVHNTFGERHVYLLRPDPQGRATAAKDFYVSPFLPVTGQYRMRLPEPADSLRLAVTLDVAGRHGDGVERGGSHCTPSCGRWGGRRRTGWPRASSLIPCQRMSADTWAVTHGWRSARPNSRPGV